MPRSSSTSCAAVRADVAERILCLDTTVLIKYLTPDERDEQATQLVEGALRERLRLIAPAWGWAEVGSVLRKKVRAALLSADEADALWGAFLDLPIDYTDSPALRQWAWEIAAHFGLPTLYDAAFIACMDVAPHDGTASRELWTADDQLWRQLGTGRPPYMRRLGGSS